MTFRSAPDFENPSDIGGNNVYQITVQARADGNSVAQNMIIIVTDIAPVISSPTTDIITVPENTISISPLSASSPLGEVSFTIAGGSDAGEFILNDENIQFVGQKNFEGPEDFDANNIYQVDLEASDGTETTLLRLSVVVTDVNDGSDNNAPEFITTNTLSIPENQQTFQIEARDDDAADEVSYDLVFSADWDDRDPSPGLSINRSTGVITFVETPNFEQPNDANEDNRYEVTVQISDGKDSSLRNFIITIDDVNDPPVILTPSVVSIAEKRSAVHILRSFDEDGDELNYRIVSGADSAQFFLEDSSTQIVSPKQSGLFYSGIFNHSNPTDNGANNIYDVTIEVSDGSSEVLQSLTIMVEDLPEFMPGDLDFSMMPIPSATFWMRNLSDAGNQLAE